MIDVLIMGGTWNPGGDPVTEAFARRLDPELFRVSYIGYPASYGGAGMPYAESVRIGKWALADAIDVSPNPVLLAGYSQGAGIAGDLASEIGAGMWPNLEVVGAALIADPLRPAGHRIGEDPGGYGVAGERFIDSMPVWHAAASRDPITALPRGSMLRSLADFTAYWSMSSPQAMIRWGQSILDAAAQRRMQRWWSPINWIETADVTRQASAYLFEGRHTDAYIREGHCVRLADAVNEHFG
ncbi:hypothetical protein ACIGO9_28490 [Nocardia asteroides]|uniref:hypothetical protein n=1 Tax=Nocardia asteroides TaxID=1824 RepID=UPI0037CC9262